MKSLIPILITGVFIFGLFPCQAKAQILEPNQAAYGMDYAPCTQGLERRVTKVEGMESVSVSQNNSLLEEILNSGNNLTLRTIRKLIEDSGFQPGDTEFKVADMVI